MKKFIINFQLILTLILSLALNVSADDSITIYVNENLLQCDTEPYIENGRTMVPMRKIFESLDAKVDWEGTTQTITATKDNTEIVLQINNYTMYSNGVEETLDIAPVIINDSTFVPLRAVSQSLKASVEWFGYTHSVYINSPLTYSNEYKSYVDFFMQGAVPAGYELKDNVSADAVMHTDICVQGVVSDVNIKNNDVYLIVENRYTQGEKIAVYISDLESTSIEKMTEMFKGKNVSVGGRYLGYTNTFNSAAVNLRHIGVCETEEFYSANKLTYPLLSQIDEKVLLAAKSAGLTPCKKCAY